MALLKICLGEFLRKKRFDADMSQNDVATKLGYSSQFVTNWERGVSSPPANVIPKLMKILKISESEMLEILVDQSVQYWRSVVSTGPRRAKLKRKKAA